MELPTGTVTFLFTDVEGSTRLLQTLEDRYADLLAEHSRIVEGAIREHDGIVVNTDGDAHFCVFRSAPQAAAAAVDVHLGLAASDWPADGEFRVRIGFHTGEGALGGRDYVGLDVHRAARVSAAGHGGEALLSAESHMLVEDDPPEGVTSRDLGSFRLKDLLDPEQLFQLVIPGTESRFPYPRTGADPPFTLPPFVGALRPSSGAAPEA